MYDCEARLRLQSALPSLPPEDIRLPQANVEQKDSDGTFDVDVTDSDFKALSSKVVVIPYMAVYCARAATGVTSARKTLSWEALCRKPFQRTAFYMP